jgi:hypothetical protein
VIGRSLDEMYREHIILAAIYLDQARRYRAELTHRQHAGMLSHAAARRRAALAVKQTMQMIARSVSQTG